MLEDARIAIKVLGALERRIKKVIMWTDAMTVLSWLMNDSIRPNKFIRPKLDKLNTSYHHFESVQIEHVRTAQNLADVASRWLNLVRDGQSRINLWLRGPLFLTGKVAPTHLNLFRLM